MPGDRSPERSNYVPRGVDPRRRDDREPQRYDSRPSYEYDRGIGSSGRRPPTPPVTSRPPTPPLHRRQASPPTGPRGGGRKRRIDSIDSRSGAEVENYFGQDRRSGDGRDGYPMTHRPNDVRSYSPRAGDTQRRKTPDSVDAELDALEKLIMSIHSAMTAMSQQTLASTHVKRLESFSSGAETNPLLDARDAFRDAEKTYLARMHELREVWVSVFRRRDGRGTGTAIGGGITVDALNERLASLERGIRDKGRAIETPLITPTSAPPRPNFPSATITDIDDDAGSSKRQKTDDRLAEALVKVNSLEAMVLGFDERFNELENWAYLTEGEQQRNQPITSWEEIEAQRDPLGRLRGEVPAQARPPAVPRVAAIPPPAEDDGWGDFDNERDPDRALRGPMPAEPLSGLIDHSLLREMQASMAKINETLISHSKLIDEQKGLISVHRNMQRIMGDDVKALKEDKEALARARAEEKAEFERVRKKDAEELEITLDGFLSMIKSECKEQARIQAAILIDRARADARAAAHRQNPAATPAPTPAAAAAATPGGAGPAAATDSTGPAAAVNAGAAAEASTAPSAAPAPAAPTPSQSAQNAPPTAQATAPPQSAGPRSTAQTQSVPVLPTSATIAPAAPTSTANHVVSSGEKPAPVPAPTASSGTSTSILGAAAAAAAAPPASTRTAALKAAIVKAPARAPALPSGPAPAPNVPPPPFSLAKHTAPAPRSAPAAGIKLQPPPFALAGSSTPKSGPLNLQGFPTPASAATPPVLPTVATFWPQLQESAEPQLPKPADHMAALIASKDPAAERMHAAVDALRDSPSFNMPKSTRPSPPITTPAVQSEEIRAVSTLPRTLVPDKAPAPAVSAQPAPKPAPAKPTSTAGASTTQASAKLVLRAPGTNSATPNPPSSSSLPPKPSAPAAPAKKAAWSHSAETDRNPTPAPASNLPPRLLPSASVSSRSPSPAPISTSRPPSRPPTPALPPHSTPPPPPPSNTPPSSAPPPPPSGTPPPSAPPTPASVAPAPGVARAESESSMEMDIDETEPVVAVPPASRLSVGASQRTTSFEGRPRPPHQDIPAPPPSAPRRDSPSIGAPSNSAVSAAAAAGVPPRPSSANGQRPPTGPAVSRRSPPSSGPGIRGYANNGTGSSGTADRANPPSRSQASLPHALPARPAGLPPADIPPSVPATSAKEQPTPRDSAPTQPAIKINLDPLRFAISPLNPPPTDTPRTASNPTSAPARVSPPAPKPAPPPASKPARVPLHPGTVPVPDRRIDAQVKAYHRKKHLVDVCVNLREGMRAGASIEAATKTLPNAARTTMGELTHAQRVDVATKPLSEWGWLDAWAKAGLEAKVKGVSPPIAQSSAQTQGQGKAGIIPPVRSGSDGPVSVSLANRITSSSGTTPSGGSAAIPTSSSSSSPSSSPAPHGAPSALGARIGQLSSKGPLAGRMSSGGTGGGDGLTPTSSPSVSSPFVNLPPRPSPHVDASPWSSMLNAGLGPFGSDAGPALAENAMTAAHREAALRAELTRKKQAKEAGGGHRRSESVDSDGDVRMGDVSASASAGSAVRGLEVG